MLWFVPYEIKALTVENFQDDPLNSKQWPTKFHLIITKVNIIISVELRIEIINRFVIFKKTIELQSLLISFRKLDECATSFNAQLIIVEL